MTDNSIIPVATGNETFANHDIGGIKYPRVRITWGASGATNDADIAAGKGLPIQGTVNVGTVTTLPALPAGTAHIGEVKIDPTQLGALVAGGIPTVSGGFEYKVCPISSTTALGATTGAIGDYVEGLVCVVGTPATSLVQIKDGSGTAMDVLPSAVGAGVGTYYVPLGLISKTGGWSVITLAGTKVIATGNFT